jgi:hypothetical protein
MASVILHLSSLSKVIFLFHCSGFYRSVYGGVVHFLRETKICYVQKIILLETFWNRNSSFEILAEYGLQGCGSILGSDTITHISIKSRNSLWYRRHLSKGHNASGNRAARM